MTRIMSVPDPSESQFTRTRMRRDSVVAGLKEQGFRITRQRQALLDIILEGQCSSCKEIYVEALKRGHHVGNATVYRLVNILEEMGAIRWKSLHQLARDLSLQGEYSLEYEEGGDYSIRLADGDAYSLNRAKLGEVLRAGLQACGYTQEENMPAEKEQPGEV